MATYDVDMAQARMGDLVARSLLGEKITIASDAGNVVMVSEDDWDSLVEAMSVLVMPEVLDRIRLECSSCIADQA